MMYIVYAYIHFLVMYIQICTMYLSCIYKYIHLSSMYQYIHGPTLISIHIYQMSLDLPLCWPINNAYVHVLTRQYIQPCQDMSRCIALAIFNGQCKNVHVLVYNSMYFIYGRMNVFMGKTPNKLHTWTCLDMAICTALSRLLHHGKHCL